jgi:hypothetical protein
MNGIWRVYVRFVCGAFGGLAGWYAAALLLANTADRPSAGLRVVFGAVLGGCIGLAVAAHEGLGSRSAVRLFKFGSLGLGLGVVAGAVALPFAQELYAGLLGANAASASPGRAFMAGALAWVAFGGAVGFGETVSRGAQAAKGLLGGALGGLVGGVLFEVARAAGVTKSSTAEQFLLAVSLTLVGGAVGASIAFVTTSMRRAWLEVLEGPLAGRVYDLTKYVDARLGGRRVAIVGSDEWAANVYLPGDREVLPRHATIGLRDGVPTLRADPGAGGNPPVVNGRTVTTRALADGDRVQVGATAMVYRQKKV